MKISELIVMLEEIKESEGDCNIYMMSDAEGNSYSKMTDEYGVSYGMIEEDEEDNNNGYYDYLYSKEDVEQMIEEEVDMSLNDFEKIITLWRT